MPSLALRAAALGVLVVILLNPTRVERVQHTGPQPTALFLLDESRSMSLESPTSRSKAAQEMIRCADDRVPPDRRPAIQKYGFGRDLVAIPRRETRSAAPTPMKHGWGGPWSSSRRGSARPCRLVCSSSPTAGRRNRRRCTATARAYRELGVPVHVVPLGDERISGDVAIQDIDAPERRGRGRAVPVRVTLRSRGNDGERTELLIRQDSRLDREVLASLPVTLADGEQAHELVIDTDQAKGPLAVEVQNASRRGDRRQQCRCRLRSPPDRPSSASSTWKAARSRSTGISTRPWKKTRTSPCVSMTVDNMHAAHPRLYRIGDERRGYPATREELLSYDVVICSDIARGAFTHEQLEWTVELVGQARRRVCHDRRQPQLRRRRLGPDGLGCADPGRYERARRARLGILRPRLQAGHPSGGPQPSDLEDRR